MADDLVEDHTDAAVALGMVIQEQAMEIKGLGEQIAELEAQLAVSKLFMYVIYGDDDNNPFIKMTWDFEEAKGWAKFVEEADHPTGPFLYDTMVKGTKFNCMLNTFAYETYDPTRQITWTSVDI